MTDCYNGIWTGITGDILTLQRCSELAELSQNLTLMQNVLPVDASCEDLEVS